MNDDAKQGLNTAERGRTRNALNENRKELRRARRAAENDDQKDDLQVRIAHTRQFDANERRLGCPFGWLDVGDASGLAVKMQSAHEHGRSSQMKAIAQMSRAQGLGV